MTDHPLIIVCDGCLTLISNKGYHHNICKMVLCKSCLQEHLYGGTRELVCQLGGEE